MVHLGDNLVQAKFEARRRRFLADVKIGGRTSVAFVPNTGRLEGILARGNRLYLKRIPGREVPFDVLVAYDGEIPVVVDSRIPNEVANEALSHRRLMQFAGYHSVDREVRIADSRLDFVLRDSRPCFLEVKGCTMAREGISLYPDAPTERGRKHLELLMRLHSESNRAAVLFLAMRTDVEEFRVNEGVDRLFGRSMRKSLSKGVEAYAYSIALSGGFDCTLGSQLRMDY
jgi:sugar fermentation stimulation protein A